MKLPLTGGCACGAIRYECGAEPMAMFYCHCRDCQQAGGGACAAAVLLPVAAFRITCGEPRYFETSSLAGGTHRRGFCAVCGSRILGAVKEGQPFIGVLAGSLDDPSIFQPSCHIFVADAQPWHPLNDGLPRYRHYMPL
jgi:hypothetical protein